MIDAFLDLHARLAALEKRASQMMRHGPVAEVNASEQWVRLDLGDGLLSPKVPYAQVAGALKIHAPPSVGQQMTLIAPNGDPAQAVALPMTWSDANASPSSSGSENVLTFGNVRAELRAGELVIKIGDFSLTLTASGASFSVGGVSHQITGGGVSTSGGRVEHDGKNIGSSHRHPGIERGGSRTDPPD